MDSRTKQQILNLSSDLRRIAWWACDGEGERDTLIEKFLSLAKRQRQTLKEKNKRVDGLFKKELLDKWREVKNVKRKRLIWAEEVLTVSLRLKHFTEAPFS